MKTLLKLGAKRTLLIVGAAAILLGTSGVAAVKAWVPSPTGSSPPGVQTPTSAEAEPRARVSCAECGVVLSKRRIGQAGAGPKGYEITVRMADGSSRAFVEANPANWRPGQRLIVIDGAGNLASSRD